MTEDEERHLQIYKVALMSLIHENDDELRVQISKELDNKHIFVMYRIEVKDDKEFVDFKIMKESPTAH